MFGKGRMVSSGTFCPPLAGDLMSFWNRKEVYLLLHWRQRLLVKFAVNSGFRGKISHMTLKENRRQSISAQLFQKPGSMCSSLPAPGEASDEKALLSS